jgi:hypothetical protein
LVETVEIKKFLDLRLIGIIGSILMILSQFLSWFSGISLFSIYLIMISFSLEDSFLFLFPLISGSITLVGTLLILFKGEYKINSVIIIFIGLGFFLIFLVELIPQDLPYIGSAEIGFYLSVVGALLVLFDIINILIQRRIGDVE